MSSFKDTPMSRPQSQHRTSMTSISSSNTPIRHATSRNHSHTVSLGSSNSAHRVTRRKSMTSTVSNNAAAFKAAINGAGNAGSGNLGQSNRRSMPVKPSGANRAVEPMAVDSVGLAKGDIAMPMNIDHNGGPVTDSSHTLGESAVSDGLLPQGQDSLGNKGRIRRASEGAHLAKGEGKRASGELRCEKCGKGYKHSSCLTKHLWEHTPEWAYTSKLLISKHQQVQLLEAASVLVGMNQDHATEAIEGMKVNDSDHSSASPAASGTSEIQDDYLSSTETSPPPTSDNAYAADSFGTLRSKRYSGNSSAFSRSYQSSSSLPAGSAHSLSGGFSQFQPSLGPRRPSTSGVAVPRHVNGDEEEAGLVAAVESLCNFGTPQRGAVHLPADIPPVPPLPPQYAGQNHHGLTATSATPTTQASWTMPSASTQRLSNERGALVKERGSANNIDDHEFARQTQSRGKDDDDDEIMFGRDEAIY